MQETVTGRWDKPGALNVDSCPISSLRDRMAKKPPFAEAGRTRGGDKNFHLEFDELEAPGVEMPSRQVGIGV